MSDPADPPSIPCVDLGALFHHEADVRGAAAASIRAGFATRGAVHLSEHGVDLTRREPLYRRFVELTERSATANAALRRPDLFFLRGLSSDEGGETFLAAPRAIDPSLRLQFPQLAADNVWPEGAEDFERDVVDLGQQLHEAGLSLLMGVAMALGVAQRTFDRRLEGAPHLFGLRRRSAPGREAPGIHLMSLRLGDFAFDADGELGGIEADPVPEGCIAAHVGQPLEILSGGELRARRADPTPAGVGAEHLLTLHPHQMIFPFERFLTDASLRAYSPPVLAGTYAIKTLVDRGLAPPSALDRLGYRHDAEDAGTS